MQFFFFSFLSFFFKRKNENEVGEEQTERENPKQPSCPVWSPICVTQSCNLEINTWVENKSWPSNWWSHPEAPVIFLNSNIYYMTKLGTDVLLNFWSLLQAVWAFTYTYIQWFWGHPFIYLYMHIICFCVLPPTFKILQAYVMYFTESQDSVRYKV